MNEAVLRCPFRSFLHHQRASSPESQFNDVVALLTDSKIPSRELTYPTLGKGNHLQNAILMGYVSSLKCIPKTPISIPQKSHFPFDYFYSIF